jgi:single-stranded-DNA-specific exonuclease
MSFSTGGAGMVPLEMDASQGSGVLVPLRPRWELFPRRDAHKEEMLVKELGVSRLVSVVLVSRGYDTVEKAEKFLNPSLRDLHDGRLLPDAERAVGELLLAKERGETVFVHGDYDVDGVTSAALWTRVLRRLGFSVIPHVPHRIRDGYGVHKYAVKEAHEAGAKLLLTCDCGSSAFETVEMATELGMRVVITDHHGVTDSLPRASAVVNPLRKDNRYPFPYLSGVGVAFKVAEVLAEELGVSADKFRRAFLDLVALGTVADVVPLVDENRILTKFGLEGLARSKKPGVRALLKAVSLDVQRGVSAWQVGWMLGPRLNAAGRIDDAVHALALLLTDDEREAEEHARLLEEHNSQRRQEQDRVVEEARKAVLEKGLYENPVIWLCHEGWHPGVIGIAAGKIAEEFYRPTLMLSLDRERGVARASARSIPNFHLFEALEAHKEFFLHYGGHERAAGFTLPLERISETEQALLAYAQGKLKLEDLVPTIVIDAEVAESELDARTIESLSVLEPTGEGNPPPIFLMRGAKVTDVSVLSEGQHLRFGIESRARLVAIGFGMGGRAEEVKEGACLDLVFYPEINAWRGQKLPRLRLVDFR